MKNTVGVVVVSFNSAIPLAKLLKSLSELSSSRELDLVVVDNASREEELLKLRDLANKFFFELIESPENNGFASGVNQGLKFLSERGIRQFFLLNPDCQVAPNSLEALVKASEKESSPTIYGSLVLAGRMEENGGKSLERVWSAGGFINSITEQTGMYTSSVGEGEEDKPIDYLPGCALYFSKEILDLVGFFPEEYFLYFEETAWCQKAKKLGAQLSLVGDSIVYHDFEEGKTSSLSHTYLYNRARHLFWLKHAKSPIKAHFKVFRELLRAWRAYRACPPNFDKRIFQAHIRACLDALCRRFSRSFLESLL